MPKFIGLSLLVLLSGCKPVVTDVMTFNIRWDNPADEADGWEHRKADVVRVIRERKPDLLSLQEVEPSQHTYLETQLPEYTLIDGNKSSTVLAYKTARYKLNESAQIIELPTTQYPREAVIGHLSDNDISIRAIAIHIDGAVSEDTALMMHSYITEWTDDLIIVAGDFNSIAHRKRAWPKGGQNLTPTYAYDVFTCQLSDGFRKLHPNFEGASGSGFQIPPPYFPWDARIDWILTSKEFEWLDAQILKEYTTTGRPVSDHWPQVAKLARW